MVLSLPKIEYLAKPYRWRHKFLVCDSTQLRTGLFGLKILDFKKILISVYLLGAELLQKFAYDLLCRGLGFGPVYQNHARLVRQNLSLGPSTSRLACCRE